MCAVGSADGASVGIATSTQQQPPPVMCSSTAPVSPGGPISVGDTWSAMCVPTSGSGEPIASYQFTEDDGAQLAKIEEDLRRSAEFKFANFVSFFSKSQAAFTLFIVSRGNISLPWTLASFQRLLMTAVVCIEQGSWPFYSGLHFLSVSSCHVWDCLQLLWSQRLSWLSWTCLEVIDRWGTSLFFRPD